MSPKSEAQKKAEKKYIKNITSMELYLESGKKDIYKEKAAERGMSMAKFLLFLAENDKEE